MLLVYSKQTALRQSIVYTCCCMFACGRWSWYQAA